MILPVIVSALLLSAAPEMRAATLAGEEVSGNIVTLSTESVALSTPAGEKTYAPAKLLSLRPAQAPPATQETPSVWIELIDGSRLVAADYTAVNGKAAVKLLGAGGAIEIPTRSIRSVRLKSHDEDLAKASQLGKQWQEIAGGEAAGDVIVPQPYQRLQLTRRLIERLQDAQPMLIGAQQVGEPVGIAGVGLRAGAFPAWPRGVEGVGVDRHDRMAGLEQTGDQQPIGPFDRDRQLTQLRELSQPFERLADPALAVREAEARNNSACFVDDAELVRPARPIDPDKHLPLTSLVGDTCLGAEGPSRFLTRWPSTRLTPNAGRGPSARSERRDSCWLSGSKGRRPSPSGRQEHHRTFTSGSDGMVQE
jgi:hypothetical protein